MLNLAFSILIVRSHREHWSASQEQSIVHCSKLRTVHLRPRSAAPQSCHRGRLPRLRPGLVCLFAILNHTKTFEVSIESDVTSLIMTCKLMVVEKGTEHIISRILGGQLGTPDIVRRDYRD